MGVTSAAYAGPITLLLEDRSGPGGSVVAWVEVADGDLGDSEPNPDAVEFRTVDLATTVGSFFVTVTGSITPANPAAGTPYTMDLLNFIVFSNGGTNFRATLLRTGLPTPATGAVTGGVEWYAEMGVPGSVTFNSWVADTLVLSDVESETTDPAPNDLPFAAPVLLYGSTYSARSTLDFNFGEDGQMTANTKLEVKPTGVPEPTTLLLFGPGMIGLLAFGRRVRTKVL
jgi:hypothetical protein